MSDLNPDVAAIQERHDRVNAAPPWRSNDGMQAHWDRGILLAAIDELTAELAESRAAYDAICRSVGASLRRPMQHGADPDPLTLDGGAA